MLEIHHDLPAALNGGNDAVADLHDDPHMPGIQLFRVPLQTAVKKDQVAWSRIIFSGRPVIAGIHQLPDHGAAAGGKRHGHPGVIQAEGNKAGAPGTVDHALGAVHKVAVAGIAAVHAVDLPRVCAAFTIAELCLGNLDEIPSPLARPHASVHAGLPVGRGLLLHRQARRAP